MVHRLEHFKFESVLWINSMGVTYKVIPLVKHLGVWSRVWILKVSQIIFDDLINIDVVTEDEFDSEVWVTCRKCKKISIIPAYMHIYNDTGCPICTPYLEGSKSNSWSTFAINSHRKWPGLHLYIDTIYKNTYTRCEIYCLTHNGYANVRPNDHLYSVKYNGCPDCGRAIRDYKISQIGISLRSTVEKFISQARLVHGNIYDYTLIVYINMSTHITIICPIHKYTFRQTPNVHLFGQGCRYCGLDARYPDWSTENFIRNAIKAFGIAFDYSKVICKGKTHEVTISCRVHNVTFTQSPKDHLNGIIKCASCGTRGTSLISKGWLEFMRFRYKTNDSTVINKFVTGKEHRIPNTRFHVDGLIAYNTNDTKIALEFHGTYWHGDPTYFEPNWILRGSMTFGKAYSNTLQKEQIIRAQGYTYLCIWEHKWRLCIHVLRKLQRIYRLHKLRDLCVSLSEKQKNQRDKRKAYHQPFNYHDKLYVMAKNCAAKHFNGASISDPILIANLNTMIPNFIPTELLASDTPGDILEPL